MTLFVMTEKKTSFCRIDVFRPCQKWEMGMGGGIGLIATDIGFPRLEMALLRSFYDPFQC